MHNQWFISFLEQTFFLKFFRNCGTCFGSNDSVFFQLSPRFIRVAKPSSFYCNLKFRSLPMKISFDKYFILDNAFHGVSDIEVCLLLY